MVARILRKLTKQPGVQSSRFNPPNKMSTLQLEALEDFFVLNSNKEFYVRKYGYVLKIEEGLDGHLYRSMNVHAGGDTLDCAILDCQAIAKDYGKELKLDENW